MKRIATNLRMKRIATAFGACALAAGAAPAPVAAAPPTASQIASPSDPAYVLSDGSTQFVVTGSTNASGNVDLDCFDGAGGVQQVATNRTPGELAAGIPVSAGALASAPCVMRAVPAGDASAHPPGTADPFAGPRVFVTSEATSGTAAGTQDYDVQAFGLGGFFRLHSAGGCSIAASRAIDPASLTQSASLFECAAALDRLSSRAAVVIDGEDAYSAADANPATPGWRGLAVAASQDARSGDVTIDETDPYLSCAPSSAAYPPSGTSCSSLNDTGVWLHRSWLLNRHDEVADETDSWQSTDGRRHGLDALYEQRIASVSSGSPPFAAFDFPGSPGFRDYANGERVPLPRGTGSVEMKEDGATPDTGDGQHPHGALTWASAPDAAATFVASDQDGNSPDFLLPYRRTVPAAGSLILRFAFAQSFALADSQAAARAAEASYRPSISITSPADGSTTDSSSVLVTGTASDGLGVRSVTVDGDPVVMASDGTWSAPLNLVDGPNTVTAAATNVDGTTAQQQITVNYVPAHSLTALAAPHATRNGVAVTLRCNADAGACTGVGSLSTREVIRKRRLVRLAAARTRARTVVVGSRRFSIPAGTIMTLNVPLNATGRRLLKRFGRLPVRMTIDFVLADGKAHRIKTGTVTLKLTRKRRRASPRQLPAAAALRAM